MAGRLCQQTASDLTSSIYRGRLRRSSFGLPVSSSSSSSHQGKGGVSAARLQRERHATHGDTDMFDACGALRELPARQLDSATHPTASFYPPTLSLVATATQIFTLCPVFLTWVDWGPNVSAPVCEGRVTRLHPRWLLGLALKPIRASAGLLLLLCLHPLQLPALCPPPQLSMWREPTRRESGWLADPRACVCFLTGC